MTPSSGWFSNPFWVRKATDAHPTLATAAPLSLSALLLPVSPSSSSASPKIGVHDALCSLISDFLIIRPCELP
ncbi:hypothetical protein QYF36_023908 [Acer negundo]|nr:hypothetical protein QYF36_023908 [Acer negundo]